MLNLLQEKSKWLAISEAGTTVAVNIIVNSSITVAFGALMFRDLKTEINEEGGLILRGDNLTIYVRPRNAVSLYCTIIDEKKNTSNYVLY